MPLYGDVKDLHTLPWLHYFSKTFFDFREWKCNNFQNIKNEFSCKYLPTFIVLNIPSLPKSYLIQKVSPNFFFSKFVQHYSYFCVCIFMFWEMKMETSLEMKIAKLSLTMHHLTRNLNFYASLCKIFWITINFQKNTNFIVWTLSY